MSDKPGDEPKKKIIIDEDWKSQVQAEKEDLERKQQEQGDEAPKPAPEAEAEAAGDLPLPPPSLEFLVSSLGMQAMIAMGLMPNPISGKPEVRLNQAKHFIDTIAMLEQKTEGNRTPEETTVISNLLHEFRMAYVSLEQKQAKS